MKVNDRRGILFYNANIYTVNGKTKIVNSIAFKYGIITFLGTDQKDIHRIIIIEK